MASDLNSEHRPEWYGHRSRDPIDACTRRVKLTSPLIPIPIDNSLACPLFCLFVNVCSQLLQCIQGK